MPKINMIKKHKEHAHQYTIFNPKDHDVLGTSDTEGIEELIEQKINEGHAIFHVGSNDTYVVYVSKKTDGFFREVTADNWHRTMQLNVFERDHSKWVQNVENYFKLMMEDEDTKEAIRAAAYEAVNLAPYKDNPPFDLPAIIEEAKIWLCKQEPKKGTSGGRKTNVWDYLCGPGKDKFKRPTPWIKRAAYNYVERNTPKKRW